MEPLLDIEWAPRNLCVPFAEWLTTLGFETEQDSFTQADAPYCTTVVHYLAAQWHSEQGPCFRLEYTWNATSPAHATLSLWVQGYLSKRVEMLLAAQRVPTLEVAQRLLLRNTRFVSAYQQAHPDFASTCPYSFT